MLFLYYSFLFLFRQTLERIIRWETIISLRMEWRFLVTLMSGWHPVSVVNNRFEFARKIDIETELGFFRDMLAKMKVHRIGFRDIGINPIEFWDMVKSLGKEIREEIDHLLRATYVGARLVKQYFSLAGEALRFVREQSPPMAVVVHCTVR